jgi:hypothetical protein
MIVVSDTSPISHLFKIGRLHLLQELFGKVILPESVWDELQKLETDFQVDIGLLKNAGWLEMRKVGNAEKVHVLKDILDDGEAEAIVLAAELNADYLLMDETKGRAVAKALGLNTIGALGILISAKEHGLIPALRPLVQELTDKAGAWISPKLISQVLADTGEK